MKLPLGITFVDVENEHRLHPETFQIPSWKDRASIPVGGLAKLIFQTETGDSERMWVQVTAGRDLNGVYTGILRNHPVFITEVVYGDTLWFKPEHVADIAEASS